VQQPATLASDSGPADEAEHFIRCPTCGGFVDTLDRA
jgi:hypothetical protein